MGYRQGIAHTDRHGKDTIKKALIGVPLFTCGTPDTTMTDRQKARERAKTSMEVIGNPKPGEPGKNGVTEGEHFDVLAYTDFMDMFIPTVVNWENGELDSFNDIDQSRKNKQESMK